MKWRHQRSICLVLVPILVFLNACASHHPQVVEPVEQIHIPGGDLPAGGDASQKPAPEYVADKRSKILYPAFHKLSCAYVRNTGEENRVYFYTIEEALASGRETCKACGTYGDLNHLKEMQSLKTQVMYGRSHREGREKIFLGMICLGPVVAAAGLTALGEGSARTVFLGAGIVSASLISLYFIGKFVAALSTLGA